MEPPCPFDIIIITSPDSHSAHAVRELILSSGRFPSNYLEHHPDSLVLESEDGTLFISSSDPFGVRMGSGGGTIAALNQADIEYQKRHPNQSPTVLICHAGGESSRCPSQIALGKAWTSLPVVCHEYDEATGAKYCCKVVNPTSLLIHSLSVLFGEVPKGSVVVAASDVLLSFGDMKKKNIIDFNNFAKESSNQVIGLAVPAPLSTAKNHGVFVLDSEYNICLDADWHICPTYRVLQKPGIEEMLGMVNPPCTFLQSDETSGVTNDQNQELLAWIDTGVITFLPGAAETLRELTKTALKSCTQLGLTQMYEESCRDGETQSLEEFAKHAAMKICLYSDILHSLKTVAEREELPLSGEKVSSIHKSLSRLELFTCAIPTGSFIHLGTTSELLDFLTHGTSEMNNENARQVVKSRNASFGRSISLTRRACASVNSFERDSIQSSVILNTFISGSCRIGCGSVIEHSDIVGDSKCPLTVEIGERCLISGLRNIKGSLLRVPSGICLQLLPLAAPDSAFVCLCFGVGDDIKASPPNTLFGVHFQHLLQRCGLNSSDLWDDDVDKRMIWNAKIMPVVAEDEEMKLDLSFLEWVHACKDAERQDAPSPLQSLPALKQWKESCRLSISQLRQSINPEAEVLYRKSILSERTLRNNSFLAITERSHEPCDLDYIVDFATNTFSNESIQIYHYSEVRRILHELESQIWRSAEGSSFDIVGRCFMTMAMLLSDIHGSLSKSALNGVELETLSNENEDTVLATLVGPFWCCSNSRSYILNIKGGTIGPFNLSFRENEILRCCTFLEKAASVMVGRCVRGNVSPCQLRSTTCPIGIGTTVIASAPARIDLSGGWSDTPPISFEHGGAVACLAVTVDGQRPLQARVRLVKELDGILLRTESRTLANDELISSCEVRIRRLEDLKDYNNPRSECALLKCALIYLGLATTDEIYEFPTHCIQPYLNKFCQKSSLDLETGLEVVSVSTLPTGSGMGGSSILAGCILSAIARCIGVTFDEESLIHAVLTIEQMLTSGGGWQDQIGGLIPGLKLGTSEKGVALNIKACHVDLTLKCKNELSKRLVLSFTGKPRLAKDILQNVLRRWARRSSDIVDTVGQLVHGASSAVDSLVEGNFNRLGSCITSYWEQKKLMAGAESGVEPDFVKSLLTLLKSKGNIIGGTLCGAGGEYLKKVWKLEQPPNGLVLILLGGGFLAVLLAEGRTVEDIKLAVKDGEVKEFSSLSWHSCHVDEIGLRVDLVED